MNRTTIYLELLNEGTSCWRPVRSEHVRGDLYRIIDRPPDDESWPFAAGDIVKCKPHKFQSGAHELVAYERVVVHEA